MFHCAARLVGQPLQSLSGFSVVGSGGRPPADAPAWLLELIQWWRSKAGAGLPDRSALDPVEIGPHLPHLALLEVADGEFRFRITGEDIRSRYGSLRDRPVGDVLSGCARAEILAEHRACADGGRPTLMRRCEAAADGSDLRRYWRLLLPFGRAGRTTALLAAMHFEGWA